MRLYARIVVFVCILTLLSCTRTITERDIFLPEMAQGTTFSITTQEGAIFESNRARPDIWKKMR